MKIANLYHQLFKPVDNSPLIVFRIMFGALIFLESAGAIATGWVKRNMIDPEFTFTFIGFEWLQPLPGYGMYVYYALMSLAGLMVMLGWRYRIGIITFFLMWTATYLMQKTSYNNHYYFLVLLSAAMIIMPAHQYQSYDARKSKNYSLTCPQWCIWFFILQVGIVYVYASIAKIYPDWLSGHTMKLLFQSKVDYPIVGELFKQKWFHLLFAYGGILFDGLITFFLLWKRTRIAAFGVSIFFHLFNSIIFQIGIFPYMMLAFTLFFFEGEKIRQLFLKRKTPIVSSPSTANFYIKSNHQRLLLGVLGVYFVFQLLLPLRHHLYEGKVNWTEEGHRMSWRMMLRAKSGSISYEVIDKATGKKDFVRPNTYCTPKQSRRVAIRPDMAWQFAQFLKEKYKIEGKEVAIFARSKLSVNSSPHQPMIDKNIDLASVKWERFRHSEWILSH